MSATERILIVDDDWRSIDILYRLLRDRYTLKTANTGNECLGLIEEFKPHLILLDIMMPGISGHETCRRIKFSPRGDLVRIILVSAKETIVDRQRGSDVLADDYIMKPFDHDELLAKVRAQFDALEREAEGTAVVTPSHADSEITERQQARLAAALQRLEGHSRQ
jgi:DNA-binding response OmpR family regulator